MAIAHRSPAPTTTFTQDERLHWIRELLTGSDESLPYRVAGILLLLYAQPMVKIAALRTDQVSAGDETMQAFADVVRQGKALYIGVSEWTAEQLRAGHALAKDLGIQLVSNQPQYLNPSQIFVDATSTHEERNSPGLTPAGCFPASVPAGTCTPTR